MGLRAEHPSLADYLREHVPGENLASVAVMSFNQWAFSVAALAETALTARSLGSDVTVCLWSDDTPLPDAGWSTSRALSRLFLTRTVDQNAERGLIAAGLPRAAIAHPPIRRWHPSDMPELPTPLTRSAIRQLTYRGSGMGRAILQVHPDFNTPVRDNFVWPRGWVEQATRSYAWVYDQTAALIRERGVRTVVVYNGRFTHDRAAAAAAGAEGAQVLYYDTGGLDTDFDLTAVETHDWIDLQHRMVRMWNDWDPEERERIARSWFDDRRTHADPNVHKFVAVQQRGHLAGLPEADRIVVFFSSSGDEFAEFDVNWADYVDSQEQAVAALADACRAQPGTALVVRTHPHMRLKPTDDLDNWTRAVERANPDVHFDPFSPIDSYELMQAADLVFTYGSTSGVEAAVLGRPVIVMGPSAYDELGCARRIRRPEEISDSLADPPPVDSDAALPYGLMMQRRGFLFSAVQRDADRVPTVGGVRLAEPSQVVRNLSHARLMRLKRRLTDPPR